MRVPYFGVLIVVRILYYLKYYMRVPCFGKFPYRNLIKNPWVFIGDLYMDPIFWGGVIGLGFLIHVPTLTANHNNLSAKGP